MNMKSNRISIEIEKVSNGYVLTSRAKERDDIRTTSVQKEFFEKERLESLLFKFLGSLNISYSESEADFVFFRDRAQSTTGDNA